MFGNLWIVHVWKNVAKRKKKCFSPAKANLKHIDGNCGICTARFSGGMQFSCVAAYLSAFFFFVFFSFLSSFIVAGRISTLLLLLSEVICFCIIEGKFQRFSQSWKDPGAVIETDQDLVQYYLLRSFIVRAPKPKINTFDWYKNFIVLYDESSLQQSCVNRTGHVQKWWRNDF